MDDLREPCPYRITDDCGGAFTMGCLGGAVFSAIKGFRLAPPGIKSRLLGMTTSVKVKAPVLGGNFGTWGLTFAACDCSLIYLRNKEDHWNSILAGAATGGILSMRSGPQAAVTSAIIGGVLLAMIEGISIALTRLGAEQFKPDIVASSGLPLWQAIESSPENETSKRETTKNGTDFKILLSY